MNKTIINLKERATRLKQKISIIYYASKHPALPKKVKWLIVFTIGYAMSPIDLIPDFIPVLGYLDDIIILPFLISLAVKMIPDDIIAESKIKAKEYPVSLKKNWVFGIIFVSIWILILWKIVLLIIK